MIKNHFKIAVRNIIKHKLLSFINVSGLVVGISTCLLMLMYVFNALSFDTQHKDYENIYRVSVVWGQENPMKLAGSMPAITPALIDNYSEMLTAAKLRPADDFEIKIGGKDFQQEDIFYTGKEFFDIFNYQFTDVNNLSEFDEPNTAIISQNVANKFFGNQDPVNKTFGINDRQIKVVGVYKGLTNNSHINASMFLSYKTYESMFGIEQNPWTNFGATYNYFKLNKNSDFEFVAKELKRMLAENGGAWVAENFKLDIHPISEIHWRADFMGDMGAKDDFTRVMIFLIAGIVILVIAVFNFVNIASSQFFERHKEVGIRKVVGAKKTQILSQFLIESLILTILSAVISLAAFEALNTSLYDYFGKSILVNVEYYQILVSAIVTIILAVGVLTGIYPTIFVSRFSIVDIIKSKAAAKNKLSFRKILVVAQYGLAIVLIFSSIIILKQINYMKTTDVGYEKNNVLVARLNSNELMSNYELLKTKLLAESSIKAVSGAYTIPGIRSRETFGVSVFGAEEGSETSIQTIAVDYGFIDAMKIKLLNGRNFDQSISSDSDEAVLLNSTAVKSLNLENPLGTVLNMPNEKKAKIVGIVEDFNIQSLKDEIPPLLFYIDSKKFQNVLVQYSGIDFGLASKIVQENWASIIPSEKLELFLLKDSYDKLYVEEEKAAVLINFFTFCAILLSALGLLGLASFSIKKRTKEIGIRKVLGASSLTITKNLLKDFIKLVVFSAVFAYPVGYFLMDNWLNGFAYKTSIGVDVFVLSIVVALVVTLTTISIQAIKAAIANPVESLRDE